MSTGMNGRAPSTPRIFGGPGNPGTRNTAQGINLNRDYAKAAAPETRAMLRLLRRLDPVLYIDVHVSDGFDHGYDVTYTYAGWGRHVQSDAITGWLTGPFEEGVNAFLRKKGHNPHFYPSAIDDYEIEKGACGSPPRDHAIRPATEISRAFPPSSWRCTTSSPTASAFSAPTQ
jgi:hypothetical protein